MTTEIKAAIAGAIEADEENEEYETEGPKCPYCGRQYTADEPHYFSEKYTEETCDNRKCGKTFEVEVEHSTTWTTRTKEQNQ
ncbi:MAG: hypothetical protein WC130_03670 [Kiritimatiellia bacterium]